MRYELCGLLRSSPDEEPLPGLPVARGWTSEVLYRLHDAELPCDELFRRPVLHIVQ